MNQDFLDLLSALNVAEVRFLVVGAYAVGVHGHPRATKDLDVWVDANPENARRVMLALQSFGAPLANLRAEDLETPGTGFQMGLPPRRIDVLTQVSGLEFQTAWNGRVDAQFAEGVTCSVIGLNDLLTNKRAADRLQDRADVEALERLQRLLKSP